MKIIIIFILVLSVSLISAKPVLLKYEKSIDSGKTFLKVTENIKKFSFKNLPANQILTDNITGTVLYTSNNGRIWRKEIRQETDAETTTNLNSFIQNLEENYNVIQVLDYTGKILNLENLIQKSGIFFVSFESEQIIYFQTILVIQ